MADAASRGRLPALLFALVAVLAPAAVSAAATPAAAAAAPAAAPEATPIEIRIGLASDLPQVRIQCCLLKAGETLAPLEGGPFEIEPASEAVAPPTFRLQMAALRDEGQARELAARLAAGTAETADVRFDAASGLYRVHLGRFTARADAESKLRQLAVAGLTDGWVVTEGGGLTDPALRLRFGEVSTRVAGRWLTVEGDAAGVLWEGRPYRGRLLVFLNDRGTLNVINELALEEYLRGVVPQEMGPALYGRLEALKAQAVAARTYTLRNLGEFAADGYDLCATVRCQAYGGRAVEHPLSDRAVAVTASQVLLWRGELIDALYSATCGGHTEKARFVFPHKDQPYLAAVPCAEAGARPLAGALSAGTPFPHGLTHRLLPSPAEGILAAASDLGAPRGRGAGVERFAARLQALATMARLPAGHDRLASLMRGEVRRYVGSLFDLKLAPAVLADGRLVPGAAAEPLDEEGAEQLLLALAEQTGVVRRQPALFVAHDGDRIEVRTEAGALDHPLTPDLATFRHRGSRLVAGEVALVAGDPVTLYRQDDRLLALVHEVDPDHLDPPRRARGWSRFRSEATLATRVEETYPGLGFSGLEVLERGASGRIARLRLLGAGDEQVEVAGLPVRWLLDLPDTWFSFERGSSGGRQGWWFRGRGRGHGVGLCQIGGYTMAGRGSSYRDILSHYYSGSRLVRVRLREPGSTPATGARRPAAAR